MSPRKYVMLGFALILFAYATYTSFSNAKNDIELLDEQSEAASVVWLQNAGILTGDADGNLRLNDPINRAEFLKILTLVKGGDLNIYKSLIDLSFTDVEFGAWYTPYLQYAVAERIAKGYSDNTFKPAKTITYGEATKMVTAAFFDANDSVEYQYKACKKDLSSFGEGNPWYWNYLKLADSLCILPEIDFSPMDEITRGEMVEMLYRAKAVSDAVTVDAISGEVIMEPYAEGMIPQNIEGENDISNKSVVDVCTAEPVTNDIGRKVYPIKSDYQHLSYLGELFTAADCGEARINQLSSVKKGNYTVGSSFTIDFYPAPELANAFWEIGFRCADAVDLSSCKKWELNKVVPVKDLLKLQPYYREIESDDCVMCG